MDLTQLYNDPNVIAMAQAQGITPSEYISRIMTPTPNVQPTSPDPVQAPYPPQGGVLQNNQPAQRIGTVGFQDLGLRPDTPQGGVLQNNQSAAMGTVGFQDLRQDPILSASGQGATQGALSNSGAGAAVVSRPNSGPSSGSRQTPTNNTSNARNSGMPDMRIGRSEGLGRIGTAMLAGNKTGLMDAMAAGGDAMYATSDANRQADLGEYENSERLRLEKVKEAQVAAALAARGGGGGSGKGKEATLAAASAIKLRDVDAALQGLDDYDGVVGMGYWFNVGWDKITDSQRATIRQKIARVKVDATLANTALTKGAISDKEMAIFQSDQPAWTDGENAWRTWLSEYRNALMIMNTNLATGASPYLQGNNSSGGGSTAAPSAFNPSDYTIEEID